MDSLVIAGREFKSRLFIGTGKFGAGDIMSRAIRASGTDLVTVALRRVELNAPKKADADDLIERDRKSTRLNSSHYS